jgi:hypothetical protein
MLLSPEDDLLARVGSRKAIIAPRACELAREPGVGELSDRERPLVIDTNKHLASVA